MYGFDQYDRELLFATLRSEPLRKTSMPVAPYMENALGYCGFRRCVAFKVAEPDLVYWMDGIDDGIAEVSLAVEPEELTIFESSAQALRMELEELV